MTGPYAQAAGDYWAADWKPLPLPPRSKQLRLTGFTGNDGDDPSYPDLMAWTEGPEGDGNIALRLPEGVIGLDIDAYDGKAGKASLESGERLWGELPATWRTTSRDDGVSGIRLYRVPRHESGQPLRWPGTFGPGTETIRRGHRYVVAPPSIHPEGRRYRWVRPDGTDAIGAVGPRPGDLPWLPTPWVVGLTANQEAHTYQGAGMDQAEIVDWLARHNHGEGPCRPMADAVDRQLEEMQSGAHESLRLLMQIVGMGAVGHDGLKVSLETIRDKFIDTAGRRRDGGERTAREEWVRSLCGAVDKVVGEMAKTGTPTSRIDPCDVLFSPGAERVDSPVPGATKAPDDILSQPAPGSGEDASAEPGDDDSLDFSGDHADSERVDVESSDDMGETPEQARERALLKRVLDMEFEQEARHRLAAKNAPPLTIMGIDEFLARPRPTPLVEGLLYRNSLSRIFGAPGCGKSFVALDVALRVALGWSWGGHPIKQGKVLYVMAEGDAVNNERMQAWMDRHQVGAGELRGWFRAVPHKVLLLEEAMEPLIAAIRDDGVDLIILDTKNRMMVGNENDSEDNGIMLRALDTVREATGCCALLIDHTGLGDPTRAKGSTSGEGGMDTEALVTKDGQSPAKVTVKVTRDKAREVDTAWDFMLRMHPIELDGEPVSTAVLLPVGDDMELPAQRMTASEAEVAWLNHGPVPTEVLHYEGGEAITRALPDLARYMAHDAGVADEGHIGKTMAQAQSALSEAALGKGRGHKRSTVGRAWSLLRSEKLGLISPADDKWDTNTTGKHVWSRS